VHVTAARFLDCPELAIEAREAEALLHATGNVLRHYNIETTQKTMDFIALGTCIATTYGFRAMAIQHRLKAEREPHPITRAPGVTATMDIAPGSGVENPLIPPGVDIPGVGRNTRH
jgi:hypothetical protein